MSPRLLISVLLLLFLVAPIRAADDPTEFFEKKIRPVLVAECYDCHSSTAKKLKGNLKLDTRQSTLTPGDSGKPPITPGDPDRSLLLTAIRQTDPDLTMPPKKQLPASVVKDFETWIRLGAPDPRTDTLTSPPKPDPRNHWAFQPLRDPALPTVSDPNWIRTPIDAFVLTDLDKRHLKPNPPADRRTLIRRAYYDLTGLPPTYEEVQAFESDPSPDAYVKLIDRLLASPRYGERYGRHWLDLARYADTKGYVYSDREEARFVHSHTYRDWVIAALNKDLPYDQFLKLQIAADQIVGREGSGVRVQSSADRGLATSVDHVSPSSSSFLNPEPYTPNPDLAALGFLTLNRRFLGVIPDIIDDRIDTLTRTTQGLSVGCARCHDHKFDPIPIADYYSLYGVFDASAERIVPLTPPPANKSPEYLAYEAELKTRTDKLADTFAKRKDQAADRARAKAADYLVALLTVDKIPDELFYEFRDANSIYPAIVRQWQQYLFARDARNTRIWKPWFELTKLPTKDFESRAAKILGTLHDITNPHLIAALSAAPPSSPATSPSPTASSSRTPTSAGNSFSNPIPKLPASRTPTGKNSARSSTPPTPPPASPPAPSSKSKSSSTNPPASSSPSSRRTSKPGTSIPPPPPPKPSSSKTARRNPTPASSAAATPPPRAKQSPANTSRSSQARTANPSPTAAAASSSPTPSPMRKTPSPPASWPTASGNGTLAPASSKPPATSVSAAIPPPTPPSSITSPQGSSNPDGPSKRSTG